MDPPGGLWEGASGLGWAVQGLGPETSYIGSGTWGEAGKGVSFGLSCPHTDSKQLTPAWPHKTGPVQPRGEGEEFSVSV